MRHILLTGFPGYLGSRLLEKLIRRDEPAKIYALVQQPYLDAARKRAQRLLQFAAGHKNVELFEGDITQPKLGLDEEAPDPDDIHEIFHLAAAYNLGIPAETGEQVNEQGSRNVLNWALRCSRLERFHYMSTCYVSGRYSGTFTHRDLDVGQSFNNHYEESKFRAEQHVQEAMRGGMPVTIYRPSIVVGDSRTGFIQKYDGPYYILQWLMRQPDKAPLPVVGDPTAYTVNLVPSDYVLNVIDHLSQKDVSAGNVYQICDPSPLTVDQILKLFGRLTRKQIIRIPLPLSLTRGALKYLPGTQHWTGIEPEAVSYFVHPTQYDDQLTREHLQNSVISCPPFKSYAHRLVSFVRAHPRPPDRYPIDIL